MERELIDKIQANLLTCGVVFSFGLAICVYKNAQEGIAIFGILIFCIIIISAYFEYLRIKKE